MTANKAMPILQVLMLLQSMPRGVGWVGLTDIAFWANSNRSTTYRYLKELVKIGCVEEMTITLRKKPASRYRITAYGMECYKH